ncbi:hypothetical protein K3136_02015 [Qipengyuania gelatinilytica]|uniref:Uncharacterized protein n=2 Tax=Qipengyuania gelatinilytica TaxID=2867231 RepID=A0ABX9A592_9SPHN|nr:hypothetical protein K3136_02015 [Qipengyuania gelatinilytica]
MPAVASEPEEKKDEKKTEAQQPAEVKDKKICRYIRMDMSSRRKEKVCLTKEGWTDFNQGN